MKRTRREFIKTGLMASGGVILGASALGSLAKGFETRIPVGLEQPINGVYTLPDLPYAYDALEPFIDRQTMELHHGKHHAGYVKNLNAMLEKNPKYKDVFLEELLFSLEAIPESIRQTAQNNGGGHWNHTFFWTILSAKKNMAVPSELEKAIIGEFGSLLEFRAEFTKAALSIFGSGWVWLAVMLDGTLQILTTPNQNNLLMYRPELRGRAVIALDVWEHAYYLKYQNRRPEYVDAFWNIVNWEQAAENYRLAMK
jgi:superoxide dismutase, Fe-Mn family